MIKFDDWISILTAISSTYIHRLGIDDDEDPSDEDPNDEEENIKEASSGSVREGDEQSESCGKDEGTAKTGNKFVVDGANTEEISKHCELVPVGFEQGNSLTKADSAKVKGMDKVTIGTNETLSTLKCSKQSSNSIKVYRVGFIFFIFDWSMEFMYYFGFILNPGNVKLMSYSSICYSK